jgi:septal ring factor EnvC (AmiA/AmiB activator)
MPRPPNGRVGRSAGVAEHRVARHRTRIRLARTTSFSRVSALACVVVLALAGSPSRAGAQAAQSVADARARIDTTASQWFGAQTEAANLDVRIETLTKTMATMGRRVDELRVVANARSVQLYESNGQMLDGIIGDSPLEIGRRAALIGQANSDGQHAIDQLEASIADLKSQRNDLQNAKAAQTQTMRYLSSRRRTLDAQLMSLQEQTSSVPSTEAIAVIHRTNEPATTASPTRPPAIALTSAPTPPAASTGPVAPPDTGQVNPHHDDPFLACTRARESSGDYTVVSSSGYYGAYQFSPTTWNVTASHAGRLDLIGVLPSLASPYDQDQMAWTLYQWQGDAPWGGRC